MRARSFALLLGTVLLALVLRVWWRVETEWPIGGPTAEIVIAPGTSLQNIALQLTAAGLVKRSWSFSLLARLRGDESRMKAGRYRFSGPYSLLDVEQKLVLGLVERREVTFREGLNVFDMAEVAGRAGLDRQEFLAAAQDPSPIADLDPAAATLEGYLFPETYDLQENATPRTLAAEMVRYARNVFTEMDLTSGGRVIGGISLSLREIVTLASIVELETAAPEERPRIAGVFLNRLRLGMRLQTDPTVIYALKLEGRYNGNIRKVDLSSESRYNTYRFPGLPPGPIGSPGRSALTAVLNPLASEDLYFVSRNDGTHVFSSNLRDHERAVDEFQRRRTTSNAVSPGPSATPSR